MGDTTTLGLAVPTVSDAPDLAALIRAHANSSEALLVPSFGTTAARDAARAAVPFKDCWVGTQRQIWNSFTSKWIPLNQNWYTRGPSGVVDAQGPVVICTITAQLQTGRLYEITGQIKAQQITSAGKPTVYLATGSTAAGLQVRIIDGHDTYAASDDVSNSAQFIHTGNGDQVYSLIASSSAGSLRFGANSAAIWCKDIGPA